MTTPTPCKTYWTLMFQRDRCAAALKAVRRAHPEAMHPEVETAQASLDAAQEAQTEHLHTCLACAAWNNSFAEVRR